ncbi:class I SAM-dependent methyltransferase [Stenomitos frigidus]|uniref:Methyltransferase type 11 domain-containing protein n=1 Tax=Stenomitos frigidus ULC18 TaxID=2107698 RepID=A0A2T1ESL8_9CYAN|nr:class I SAM-dependent methyltransferase [Stenomitos frigidus]PSB35725.1 hypothetical protein C7B82_00450 [Stenomitos frigidus ULC18]
MQDFYSVENAKKFNWSSISGNLNPERVSHLNRYLLGKKILDAGCGGGAYVEFLSQKNFEITGIDKYNQFLDVARERGQSGTYVQGDVTDLPFADKTFDCTYCFDVLEHVDDHLAIQELIRVTEKRLIIAVPKEDETMHRFGLTFAHYQDKTHLRNYTSKSLEELFLSTNHSSFHVFTELDIPTKYLVREMIEFSSSELISNGISQKILKKLSRLILNLLSYRKVATGLIAVINL